MTILSGCAKLHYYNFFIQMSWLLCIFGNPAYSPSAKLSMCQKLKTLNSKRNLPKKKNMMYFMSVQKGCLEFALKLHLFLAWTRHLKSFFLTFWLGNCVFILIKISSNSSGKAVINTVLLGAGRKIFSVTLKAICLIIVNHWYVIYSNSCWVCLTN